MNCKNQLSRWIYKKLINNYVQASFMNDYNFLYSGLKNSGLLQQKTEQKNRAKVKKVLSELVKEGVVRTFNVKSNKYGGRKIIDVKYTINATQEFISEQKAANKRKTGNA